MKFDLNHPISFSLPSSLLVLLLLLLQNPIPVSGYGRAQFCTPTITNSTKYNALRPNLDTLLSSLSNNTPPTGFFNNTVGTIPANQVYGLALCQADLTPAQCQPCIDSAAREIVLRCPNAKGAVIWYDECLMRYNTTNFFSSPMPQSYHWNSKDNVSDPMQLNVDVNSLTMPLIRKAADSPLLFATAEANFTGAYDQKLYSLAQCTRDLTPGSCYDCLKYLKDRFAMEASGRKGSKMFQGSCVLWYEMHPFYKSNVSAPDSPPSTTTPKTSITATEVPSETAATGRCQHQCGDVSIPYPFGTGDGEGCYRPNFRIKCDDSFRPPRPIRGRNIQVLDISVSLGQMRVSQIISYECYNGEGLSDISTRSVNHTSGLFKISSTENVLTAVGCDTVAVMEVDGGSTYTGGCISMCKNSSNVVDGSCSGMGCCQIAIPKGINSYSTDFFTTNNHTGILDFNPCSYVFLAEKKNYTFHKNDLREMDKSRVFPTVLDWAIRDYSSCEEAQSDQEKYACVSPNSYCIDATNGNGYLCNCSQGYQGNPYLKDGCQDINECEDQRTYPCNGTCINMAGGYTCTCPEGTSGNATTYGCIINNTQRSSKTQVAIVVPVAVVASLLFIILSITIYSQIQKRNFARLKERYFLQNGGSILQKQISSSEGIEQSFRLFTREEIEKATSNYDQSMILGRGGQGVVYKGILPNDSTTLAIKKSLEVEGSKVEEFINEISILSRINHKNVVKLVGCCLELEAPLLVYEFVPNGTLSHHIRNGSMSWETRLRIAAEIAGALGYLHSSISIPIIHRDVKSSNILLDNEYTAKVSDFGASMLLPGDKILVTALVLGTLGYLDPEYMQTQELTDKSDVYSFGVVLVELLTGKEPLSSDRDEEERCLAKHFISCMKENRLDQLLDMRIINTTTKSQMKEVANIALQCLSMRGEDRLTMKEVAMELEGLRRTVNHSWLSHGAEEEQSLLDEPLNSYVDESGEC